MSWMKARADHRPDLARRWGGVVCTGALIGLVAFVTSDGSRPVAEPGVRGTSGAHRHERERRAHGPAQPRPAQPRSTQSRPGAAEAADRPLSPELELRLRAAAHVATVPGHRPAGAAPVPPPLTGPLSPEAAAQRHAAIAGWRAQAQALLNECVARPAAERGPVPMDVFFAPAPPGDGPTAPRLTPAAVSVPPHELERLWRDVDPDELQACLERVRTLALPLPPGSEAPAQAPSVAIETVLVQL